MRASTTCMLGSLARSANVSIAHHARPAPPMRSTEGLQLLALSAAEAGRLQGSASPRCSAWWGGVCCGLAETGPCVQPSCPLTSTHTPTITQRQPAQLRQAGGSLHPSAADTRCPCAGRIGRSALLSLCKAY